MLRWPCAMLFAVAEQALIPSVGCPNITRQLHGELVRAAIPTIGAIGALAPVLSAQDYEQWNNQRVLSALSGLQLSPELECEAEGVESSVWAGQQDKIAELHHGLLSPFDGLGFPNCDYVQAEHIVVRKEADESGMCNREETARKQFAAALLNLTLAPGSLNASKGDDDAYDLETAENSLIRDNLREHELCWWAAQTIRVKAKYRLSVDTNEKSALRSILEDCTEEKVYRPKVPIGPDWVFRTEFLDALSGDRSISQCSDLITDTSRLQDAVSSAAPHLPDIACAPCSLLTGEDEHSPETTPAESTVNPRASQIAAQNACIRTLESGSLNKNCTNIRNNCPSVDPIKEGEPLYNFLRDTDDNGVVCESL